MELRVKAVKGTATSEYMLILALIGIAAVAGLMLTGNSVDGLLSSISGQFKPGALGKKAALTAAPAHASGSGQDASASQNGPPMAGTGESPTGSADSTGPSASHGPGGGNADGVSADSAPSPVATIGAPAIVTKIATSGSNGSEITVALANEIQKLADQLKLDPNADPSLIDLITKVANAGHQIAGVEATIAGTTSNQQQHMDPLLNSQMNLEMARNQLQMYVSMRPDSLSDENRALIDAATNAIMNAVEPYGTYAASNGISPHPDKGTIAATETHANGICATGGQGCTRNDYQ